MSICVFRSTWFLVPENGKITEGFPVERGLEALLGQRFAETSAWINRRQSASTEGAKYLSVDDTIVEKIVPLIPEDLDSGNFREPTIQLHDPHAPDISRYFLVFRQGCNDYARLCVEKKGSGGSGGSKQQRSSKGASPQLSTASAGSVPDSPAVLPLDSVNPISATSTVLSASVSAADLQEELAQQVSRASASPTPSAAPQPGANGYHSFRIYQTYASFYHSLASGAESGSPRVQTQRQTSEIDSSSAEMGKKSQSQGANVAAGYTVFSDNPGLDAAAMWKHVKIQSHSFKGHLLPSPEIPCDLDAPAPTKYVIFVVHGVGQRAFRKMGFHFNKDCDEMRNVLLDAAQTRGLPPGSVVVLPVSWRAELNLAGNFTFGDDDELDSREQPADTSNVYSNAENAEADTNDADNASPKIDKDLKELSESFHTTLPDSSTFQGAVPVFEGQFTEILERMALESIPAVRSVLSDATMDILLYVSQKHFKKILGAVIKEVLRLHRLFAHWNPEYAGEFSFVAHSLGSALVADLLSFTVQPDDFIRNLSSSPRNDPVNVFLDTAEGNVFPFKIDKFFAFGSPLGVFHLLKHTKPIGCIHSPHILTAFEERSRKWQAARRRSGGESVKDVPAWSVYNCRLFYNVFHPHDPVAHRFESLTLPRVKSESASLNLNASSNRSPLPPPLKIPYHKSGLTRFKMDLEAKIARAKDDWAKMTFKLPTWLGGSNGSSKQQQTTDGDSVIKNIDPPSHIDHRDPQQQQMIRDENPLAAFNHHFRRVDFSLHDSVMENAYISALGAHFIYWSDLDIAAFIVSELIKN